jgi:MYXO-CTERM domain-containing protein
MSRSLVALGLLSAIPAHAWRHTGRVVAPDDRPFTVTVQAGAFVPGMTEEEVLDAVQTALGRWDDASCGIETRFGGVVDHPDPADVPEGTLHLAFADLGAFGPPYRPLFREPSDEVVYVRDGREYRRQSLRGWVVNSGIGWVTDEEASRADCVGDIALTLGLQGLIGDRLGLGPSPVPGAVMNRPTEPCTVRIPSADDRAGLNALYGPWVDFTCENAGGPSSDGAVAGVVPLDVTCALEGDGATRVDEARWDFGDGGRSSGDPVGHTYEDEDNYKVRVEVDGTHPLCGPVSLEVERFDHVTACDVPRPAFEPERLGGLEYRLLNRSDVSTTGCQDRVRWAIYDASDTLVEEVQVWEPRVRLPESGTYRVALTVGGLGGEETVEGVLDTREGNVRGFSMGDGCQHAPAAPVGAVLGLGLGALVLRRRRR